MSTEPAMTESKASGQTRQAAEKMDFTKTKLNELLQGGRPHRQKSIWDTDETGLSVLIMGPKEQRQATVTFRVVYYLKDNRQPRYISARSLSTVSGHRDSAGQGKG